MRQRIYKNYFCYKYSKKRRGSKILLYLCTGIGFKRMQLTSFFYQHPVYKKILGLFSAGRRQKLHIRGLRGSSGAVLAANLLDPASRLQVFILNDKEEAAYFANDIAAIIGEDRVLFFPASFKRSIQYQQPDSTAVVLRAETLEKIASGAEQIQKTAIVTYPESLIETVISRKKLGENTLQLHTGEKISIDFIKDILQNYQFTRVDFVYEPGHYSIRGSIVDIFSFSSDKPYRIDFFGDEVESIRTFDIESQLSVTKHERISIIPNIQEMTGAEQISFLEYLPEDTILWIGNVEFVADRLNQIYESTQLSGEEKKHKMISGEDFLLSVQNAFVVETGPANYSGTSNVFEFHIQPQPSFHKQFDMLAQNLHENVLQGYQNYLLTDNPKQVERLTQIFKELKTDAPFEPLGTTLHEGFIESDLNVCLYTDHQIFERFHKYKIKQGFAKSEAITISELNSLRPGDYIVHVDHGIGKFGGLEKVDINGKRQEVIKLVYKDNDILYISIHSLHRISKFRGKEGEEPKIYKLGSGAWQKLKDTTKKKVKDIARDLIALYAKRMASAGFRFSDDTYLQKELEASFIYEDTPDQEKATRLVKTSMESGHPMDMLICGDVGFGKTEIAVRAAFKAVSDSKQVAVLVPTTILALQHYNTFKERLKNFPCTIDYISRFRTTKEQKEILDKVKEGKVDIIIGTHRLIAKDIQYKDLGLLIIDEEQKFGVAAKEKIKGRKVNVDTLTLTATPIPRTLQFSLMGARDLAIINTPPPNRHPIHTELHAFQSDIIKEAIEYETGRNGQVFFIHNRVQNIVEIEQLIRKLCPGVSVAIAHGQMEGEKLEEIMMGFIEGDYEVLIATNIIESGLDIPNANTIIINNAQNFGLSDLHQLRGRVGRSNKKAFCYLLAPPLSNLSQEARRRLKAIEDFSDLGSGFHIAMQDLDIRGAGNMLGSEQSGFIAEIGYEMYQRILNEAIQELKESDYKTLFFTQEEPKQPEVKPREKSAYVTDCQVDTDLEILFPEEYISNIAERTRLYKELDNIPDEYFLEKFETSLIDRFGPLPDQSRELLQVVRLRWLSIETGIEKIVLKNSKMLVYFISNQMSPFYQSALFTKVMHNIQTQSRIFRMKESRDKLFLSAEGVTSVEQAIRYLKLLNQ